MSSPLNISRYIVAALFIAGSLLCNSLLTEAKPKRGRRVIAASKNKPVSSLRAGRFNPERENGYQQARTDDDLESGTYKTNPINTTNIEIIENVNSNSKAISRLTALPAPEEPAERNRNSADPFG